jgi:hypothetical protein
MQTDIKNIEIVDFLDEDFCSVQYYAFDKIKKKNCVLTLAKVPTSWKYSVEYL